jgi:L-fuconolactonase
MDDITALAQRPNVVCKISGIVARARAGWSAQDLAPTINHCLDAFGPDRVIFGGDWPVCTLGAPYRAWVEALKAIIAHRSETDQRKLLHDNAVHIYRLR